MGKRLDALKLALSSIKWIQGRKKMEMHVFELRPDAEFPAGLFIAEDARNGIVRIRGLKDGILATAGMAFDAVKYTAEEAAKELKSILAGLPPIEVKTMTFGAGSEIKYTVKRNYQHRTYQDGEQRFADMFNVLVIKGGMWNGHTFLQENLDRIIENSKKLDGKLETFFSKEHIQSGPRIGILKNYRLDGLDVYVDIIRVPRETFDEIEAGSWPGLSAEVLKTWEDPSDGEIYHDVMQGVTLLGVANPAVSSLPPLISFEIDDSDISNLDALATTSTLAKFELADDGPLTEEVPEMEQKEHDALMQAETDKLDKLQAEKHFADVKHRVDMLLALEKIEAGEMDALIEAGKTVPEAALDAFFKPYNDRDKLEVKEEETPNGDKPPPQEGKEMDKRSPDVILNEKMEALAAKCDIPFSEAIVRLAADPANKDLFEADHKRTIGAPPAQKKEA